MLSTYNVPNPLLPIWGVSTSSGRNLATMMDQIFKDFETAFRNPLARRSASTRMAMRDLGDALCLVAEVPGTELADIDLGIEGDTLQLRVAQRKAAPMEGFAPLYLERTPIGGEWSFELPYAVNIDAIEAKLAHGRLEVKLPKAPEAQPKRITVKAL
jgi:HSP20 family protein